MAHSEKIIGTSPIMRDILTRISRASQSSANVFITGKSGTGKELCAEAVHKQSDRKDTDHMLLQPGCLTDEDMHDVLQDTLSNVHYANKNSELSFDPKPLWKIEKSHIESSIDHCNGNVTRAAALLEVSPSTLYRKRTEWDDRSQ